MLLQLAAKETELEKLRAQVKSLNKQNNQLMDDLERFKSRNDQLESEISLNSPFSSIVFLDIWNVADLRLKAAAFMALQEAHHSLQAQHEEYVTLLHEARAKITVLEGRLEEYENFQPALGQVQGGAGGGFSLANGISIFSFFDVLPFSHVNP